VNNAGIAFNFFDPLPLAQQAASTISSNYFGTINVINALLPLLRESSSPRIVNVASKKHNLTIFPTGEKRTVYMTKILSART
jgi:NAD(P)-dependent dehydrogenase (short-subunit alcohol dehydrogenase family)